MREATSRRPQRTRGRIQVNGAMLAYERVGSGPPVVFVPSFVSDRYQWALQVQPFVRQHYEVIRYDSRGFGRSGVGHAPYRPSADLAGLLDALGVERVAVVAGGSDGAECALELAHDRPQLVGALVLEKPGLRHVLTRLLAEGHPLYAPPAPPTRTRTERRAHRAAMRRFVITGVRGWLRVLSVLWSRERHERYVPQFATPPVSERLGEVAAPTLIVVGELVHSLAMEEAELTRSALPHAELAIIPRVGKVIPVSLEAAEQFNRLAVAFLATHYRPEGHGHQVTK